MDHLSPVYQALSNPVILQEIFQYKSLSGRDLRLVSKLWNQVILSLPRPKLCLKLNSAIKQGCCDPSKFLGTIYPTLSTRKLARWIKISKGCQHTYEQEDMSHSRDKSDTSAAELISTVCKKYSETIQEIKVHSRVALLPTVYKILAKYCPKLKRLSVTCPRRRGGVDPTVATFDTPLPKKFKLEYIRFILDDPPHTFMQQVVNAAPNLKTLFIVGNLYPDLAQNANLSRLFHYGRGKIGLGGSSQAFNGDSLTRLISQIAKSLVYLKIGLNTDEGKYWPDTTRDEFSLPEVMPKLKVLHNRCVDIFKCPDGMGGLIGAGKRYGNLEQILFGCSAAAGKELLDKFLEVLFSSKVVLSKEVRKIVIQDLTESMGPLANLRNVFPSVTDVELFFLQKMNMQEDVNQAVFSSQLELLLQIGGLAKITLNMTLDLNLSDFVKALSDNKALFKGRGLKRLLLLRESPTNDITDDLLEAGKSEKYGIKNFIKEFESVLVATRGLELVVISGVLFRGPTAHRIVNFIRDENLPVKFY